MRWSLLLWPLLALLLLLIARQFEYVEEPVHTMPQVKPGAAAVRLLADQGKQNRRIVHAAELFPLPDNNTLLIINRQHGRLPEWQQQALLSWVSDGGLLVLNSLPLDADAYAAGEYDQTEDASDNPIARHDPLLYSLGVTSWQRHDEQQRDPLTDAWELLTDYSISEFNSLCLDGLGEDYAQCISFACGDISQWPDDAQLYYGDSLYQFALDPRIDLLHRDLFDDPPEDDLLTPASDAQVIARAGSKDRDQLLALALGDGEVWVLSDFDIFSNERVHHLDHAWLLYALSHYADSVYWSQNIEVPPLLAWLWHRAWPLILSLALLLALFIWQHWPRRSTLLEASDLPTRDFISHLHAAGDLLWRHGDRQALLQPWRDAILARADNTPPSDRWLTHLSETSGISTDRLHWALYQEPADEAALIEIASILQTLRHL